MYSFLLEISSISNGAQYSVTPRYEDSATKTVAIEANTMFHREKWNIEFIFQRNDYDLINSTQLETTFHIEVFEGEHTPGQDYIWRGRFTKMDCEFDEDGKTIRVKPKTADRYEKVIDSLDKEFDLIALEPEITPVEMVRQPVFQVNISGSDIISNFMGGTYWEIAKSGDFSNSSQLKKIFYIPGDSDTLNPDVSGEYWFDDVDGEHYRLDNAYYIKFNTGSNKWEIIEVGAPDTVVYTATDLSDMPDFSNPFAHPSIVFDSGTTSDTCTAYGLAFNVRLLTDKETVNGNSTVVIPDTDTSYNNGYSRVISINSAITLTLNQIHEILSATSLHSTEPTRYNKFDSDSLHFGGEYFVRPDSGYFPIQRNEWTGCALWFNFNDQIQDLQEDASEDITIKHCYKLPDVLKVLLSEIDEDITHEELNDYSNFFYGANSIRTSRRYPIITPKSNLVVGQYDGAASTAKIKLSDVLTMLRYVYNAHWYIDTDNKFRLEHHDFYHKGGQYYNPLIGTDLTTLLEPKTGLKWGCKQNKYTYDRQDIPERITTKWMDKQSAAFEGEPIELISEYAEKGNLEERTIPLFSADVDYIMANTSDIAKDGFVVMDTELSGGAYSLPFVNLDTYNYEGVKAQNGHLSLAWLSYNYHRHGLPTHNCKVNGTDTTAWTTRRTKVQEIEFPGVDFNSMQLIKTDLGTGKIDEFTQNLHSGAIKGKVKHDIQ